MTCIHHQQHAACNLCLRKLTVDIIVYTRTRGTLLPLTVIIMHSLRMFFWTNKPNKDTVENNSNAWVHTPLVHNQHVCTIQILKHYTWSWLTFQKLDLLLSLLQVKVMPCVENAVHVILLQCSQGVNKLIYVHFVSVLCIPDFFPSEQSAIYKQFKFVHLFMQCSAFNFFRMH